MHSAKNNYFRSFPIGREVLSFTESKAESSSSQHMNIFKEEGKDDSEDYLTSENDILFQSFISTIKDDLLTHKTIFTLTQLLEKKILNFCPLIELKCAHHTDYNRN
jgi:hypothetical protein